MKKEIAAFITAGLLVSGGYGAAAQNGTGQAAGVQHATVPFVISVTEPDIRGLHNAWGYGPEHQKVDKGAVSASGNLQKMPAPPQPFLKQKMHLGKDTEFIPVCYTNPEGAVTDERGNRPGLPWKDGDTLPFGELIVKKDVTAMAFVINFIIPGNQVPVEMKELFENDGAGQPAETAKKVMASANNMVLYNAEAMINGAFRSVIELENKYKIEKLPLDFATVQIKDIEPVQRKEKNVCTFGGRFLGQVDGFVMPLYFRAYIIKKGENCRILGVVTSDAEREMMKNGADRLAEESMK